MTTRTVHPNKGLPELGPQLDREWRTWLAQHGLPAANDIPYRTAIICDDDARTITFTRWIRNDDGALIVAPDGDYCLREVVTVQLEAPALPFPEGFPVGN